MEQHLKNAEEIKHIINPRLSVLHWYSLPCINFFFFLVVEYIEANLTDLDN